MRLGVLATLRESGKSYFNVADLTKATGLAKPSLYVFLARWTKAGLLRRLGTGLYGLPDVAPDLERLGNEYCFPSYLSFESALARFGILSQSPYALSFATPRRSRRLKLSGTEIEYRQIRAELFFGYEPQNGVYAAMPEKALCDQMYMKSLGRAELDVSSLNLSPVRKSVLTEFLKRFPERTRRLAAELGL
jgi:predicted transcriptional regulator of viral defense system